MTHSHPNLIYYFNDDSCIQVISDALKDLDDDIEILTTRFRIRFEFDRACNAMPNPNNGFQGASGRNRGFRPPRLERQQAGFIFREGTVPEETPHRRVSFQNPLDTIPEEGDGSPENPFVID